MNNSILNALLTGDKDSAAQLAYDHDLKILKKSMLASGVMALALLGLLAATIYFAYEKNWTVAVWCFAGIIGLIMTLELPMEIAKTKSILESIDFIINNKINENGFFVDGYGSINDYFDQQRGVSIPPTRTLLTVSDALQYLQDKISNDDDLVKFARFAKFQFSTSPR